MHQQKPKQEVKTLSIRIPLELYLTISQYAIDEDMTSLNAAIVALIKAGLDSKTERNQLISEFIINLIPKDELKELMNGR